MTVANIIKKSFKNVIENPSITLFLVLFLILSNFLMSYSLMASSKYISAILFICIFMLSCAFLSGWFQIIKESLNKEKTDKKNIWSTFFEGVGKNIAPISFGIIILIILANIMLMLLRFIALKAFGTLDFIAQDLSTISQDTEAIAKYFQTLSTDKLYAIYGWAISGIIAMEIFSFIFLFYMPTILNNEKNKLFLKPIIAIKDAIIFVFKNFIGSFAIFILITTLYLALALMNTIFAKNMVISVLILFIYIYFVSFVIMLIFNYYEQKNNSSNGSDSIGENTSLDNIGEKI
ncbi:MAG: hypothetical protein IJ003_05210 [Candidatus Gastranaerophilales bacterium]|nr:hypothetical protein [Candidatus Gastranaerophilales bacterium]